MIVVDQMLLICYKIHFVKNKKKIENSKKCAVEGMNWLIEICGVKDVLLPEKYEQNFVIVCIVRKGLGNYRVGIYNTFIRPN
jgi:hypothetical protein